MDEPSIGFIGAGTLATGLSLALEARDYHVVAVSSRSRSSAENLAGRIPGCDAATDPQQVVHRCRLVFVTTPDGVINDVASQVEWRRDQGVVHCSGALSLDVLEPAARRGALTGSIHPFQTLACLETEEEAVGRLEGATFAVEGQGWVRSCLETMVSRLGGRAVRLKEEDRALYHASGVLGCGYLVVLLKAAADIWQAMGVPEEEALPTVLDLAETTLRNISRSGVEASLTGPQVRGDVGVIRGHLETLEVRLPGLIPLYCCLLERSLPLVREKLSQEKLEAMERLSMDYLNRHVSSPRG